ncbi:MAG: hypothetical protein JWQ14_1939 [Adhaeribacter sp.]|nr:hypothetical protein [Adhaeribacter sp.]
METLEKAKLALRKHLLANKDKVAADLEEMRRMSEGKDIFYYVENFPTSISFENTPVCEEVPYEYDFPENIVTNFINQETIPYFYSPPCIGTEIVKKDPEILSGSFFLILLQYGRSSKSIIFI